MYIVCVTLFIKQPNIAQFREATLDNARNTRKEPGNLRFDVLQAEDDPSRFFLYEAYKTRDDFTKHQQTEHYFRWKNTVGDWMSQPRQGLKHQSIFFENSEQ
jgi:(4S)-4-hydroxy-5-phosphonooxypentane-2,3-dione isomerase